jgi:EAL domain-containing protein (putative c-di-GMP-specific phosphodiesterase class I)/DNA-binding NarL/FixJ family response regulator
MKILIVDDLKTNILVIKKALEQEGYEFIEGYDGKQAIELAKEHEPDMIIMDGLMPVMDGFEAVKILRGLEEFKRTPILMVSSLSEESMKLKAIEVGVNDFITKPFDKMELVVRCRSYMQVSRTNSQYILSSKNPNTSLPNKFALHSLLKDKEANLILFHIDNFSSVSPFYGEQSARELEKLFASYLKRYFKNLYIDISCFHINSGEFAIVFKDDVLNIDIDSFCKTLHENIKLHEIELDGFSYDISATLCFAHAGIDTLESACFVLENAVADKKTHVVMQDVIEKLKQDAADNIAMILKIKNAIEDDRIVPYFQPIFDIKSHEIVKYEALVRLIEEDGKVLSPFFFLEASKKGNYYLKITEIMLDKVFTLFNYIDKEVTINISFLDISNQAINNKIMTLLSRNPDTASRVTFEILEDEAVLDDSLLLDFVVAVREYGVKIAIDDFGSGFSNFQRVMEINPDIIKIDGSIVKNIKDSKKSQVLTEAINNFSHSLGIQTVAEFVSDEDVFMKVASLGIDYAQGYYISEPRNKLVTMNSCVKIFNKKEKSSIYS